MRALSWIIAAALAAAPAFAQQQQQSRPRIPPPGPSPTSGSDAGPFSGLTDNVPAAPRVIVGVDSGAGVQVTPSPVNDIPMRSTETVQQVTAAELERAEQEHRRAAAEMNAAPRPAVEGAFNGQTDERSR